MAGFTRTTRGGIFLTGHGPDGDVTASGQIVHVTGETFSFGGVFLYP